MNHEELEARISQDTSPVMAARQLLKERYDADAEAFKQGADVRALVHSRADTIDTVLQTDLETLSVFKLPGHRPDCRRRLRPG